jgi:hypothetical protein
LEYKLWKFEMCRRRFTSVSMAMCGGMRRHHRRREIGAGIALVVVVVSVSGFGDWWWK